MATYPNGRQLTLDMIWDGGGVNQNAALTVFRHFDSATVVKGLVGEDPKTAWVIDYPLLERIHYLLVAGYDVYGNAGLQLFSRLYMDFLRIGGEFNFLYFLPPRGAHRCDRQLVSRRRKEHRGVSGRLSAAVRAGHRHRLYRRRSEGGAVRALEGARRPGAVELLRPRSRGAAVDRAQPI